MFRKKASAVLAFLVVAAGGQAQTGWKAGAAKVDITPRESIWMAGFGSRTKPSEGVRREIFVKALALQDETGKTSVLVTADLVGITRDMADFVATACLQKYGLTRDRLVLNTSHTHSAPVSGELGKAFYFDLPPQQEPVIRRYTKELLDKYVEVVGSAIQNLAPATLSFGQGFAGFAVNRRRVRLRDLPEPVDHDVPVLSVRDSSGHLRVIVAGYACHATSLSDYQISGDWPGFAQEDMEKAYPGVIAMYVQDCGADSNPLPRRTVELSQKYGAILAEAVDQVLKGRMRPLSGPMKTAFETVDVPFHNLPTREQLRAQSDSQNGTLRRHARYLLSVLERDGKLPDHYPYPVQVWRFGTGMKFIALGGEVVVDYSLRLKKQYGWDDTWVAGYSNDVFAYIPSRRVLNEGGYEGGDSMVNGPNPAPFGEAIEEIIVEKVGDLMQETGR